jgi:small subunit ribosomal protein S20
MADATKPRVYARRIFLITHKSAIKRHRQSLKKRARNIETKSRLRTLIKRARLAIDAQNQANATAQIQAVNKALGKAVRKGIIKSNTASRWLSRLSVSAARLSAAG